MKLLCVLLPHFPFRCEVQRLPALKGRGTAVIYAVGSQKLIMDFSPELEGLHQGMAVQQALSLHGEIELVHADMPYYSFVFSQILDALEMKSPLVEGAEPGSVYIGLEGLQLMYRDDDSVVRAMRKAIPETFAPQIGIAEGKFLAYLAALYSPADGYRVLAENIDAFLKDLS